MTTNLTLPGDLMVLSLVNSKNNSDLTLADVDVGVPEEVVSEVDNNTRVTLVAKPNTRVSGSQPVDYKRLPLSGFSIYGDPVLVVPSDADIVDIVDVFNTRYHCNLVVGVDIDAGAVIPTIDNTLQDVTLTALSTSRGYVGSYTVQVTDTVPLGTPLTGTVNQLSDTLNNYYRHRHEVLDGVLYFIGGSGSATGNAVNTVRRYNMDTETDITPNATALPLARKHAGSCVRNGKVYITGGGATNTASTTSNYEFDPVANSWAVKATFPNAIGMRNHGAVIAGDYMYLYGGYNGSTPISVLIRYDFVNDSWTTLTPSSNAFGACLVLMHFDGKLYAISEGSTVVEIYDIATDSWSSQSLTFNQAITLTATSVGAVVGNYIYLFSGNTSVYVNVSDFTVNNFGVAINQTNGAAVAVGNSLLVVGGSGDPNGIYQIT